MWTPWRERDGVEGGSLQEPLEPFGFKQPFKHVTVLSWEHRYLAPCVRTRALAERGALSSRRSPIPSVFTGFRIKSYSHALEKARKESSK